MEAIWLKIVGVLLILLGLVLVASPYVPYSTQEHIRDTPLTVKRRKTFVVPRPAAVLIIAAGAAVFFVARRQPRQ